MTWTEASGSSHVDLDEVNRELGGEPPGVVLAWARQTFGPRTVAVTSFGPESGVLLHLLSRHAKGTPVVFLDTGHLAPEVYRFAAALEQRFSLDLRVYSPVLTVARQEALYGRNWGADERDRAHYRDLNEVEPLARALRELAPLACVGAFSAAQSAPTQSRPVELHDGYYRVDPLLGWKGEIISRYLVRNELPLHPLHAPNGESGRDLDSTPTPPD